MPDSGPPGARDASPAVAAATAPSAALPSADGGVAGPALRRGGSRQQARILLDGRPLAEAAHEVEVPLPSGNHELTVEEGYSAIASSCAPGGPRWCWPWPCGPGPPRDPPRPMDGAPAPLEHVRRRGAASQANDLSTPSPTEPAVKRMTHTLLGSAGRAPRRAALVLVASVLLLMAWPPGARMALAAPTPAPEDRGRGCLQAGPRAVRAGRFRCRHRGLREGLLADQRAGAALQHCPGLPAEVGLRPGGALIGAFLRLVPQSAEPRGGAASGRSSRLWPTGGRSRRILRPRRPLRTAWPPPRPPRRMRGSGLEPQVRVRRAPPAVPATEVAPVQLRRRRGRSS